MSTPMTREWVYLGRKPKSYYRQLFITGRNIAARSIYRAAMDSEDPRTPEQIAADFELPLEAVQEAIAYCESNPPEFQQDWEMEEASLRSLEGNGSRAADSVPVTRPPNQAVTTSPRP